MPLEMLSAPSLEGCPEVGERDHERHRLKRRLRKTERKVERLGLPLNLRR
jgi:hypothetical protein